MQRLVALLEKIAGDGEKNEQIVDPFLLEKTEEHDLHSPYDRSFSCASPPLEKRTCVVRVKSGSPNCGHF